jgi:hypothetical protein
MRFKNFLAEEESSDSFDDIIKSISVKCKPFLTQSEGNPLYRGINRVKVGADGKLVRQTGIASFAPHPKNRPSRDSSVNFNISFDTMMDCAFGIKDVRTHSVFASGNPAIAGSYGDEHVIFPVGEFKYVWSRLVNDSVAQNDWLDKIAKYGSQNGETLSGILIKNMWDYYPGSEEPHFASSWVKGGNAVINKTQAAYEYQFRNTGMDGVEGSVYQMVKAGMTKYGNVFYRNNADLTDALISGNEILIYESKGYYSLSIETVMTEYIKDMGKDAEREWAQMYQYLLNKIANVK